MKSRLTAQVGRSGYDSIYLGPASGRQVLALFLFQVTEVRLLMGLMIQKFCEPLLRGPCEGDPVSHRIRVMVIIGTQNAH